ncbi:E4 protein [Human papillomavirus 95]|uniref:E4 protein n=1 Tax=Human papillomavirus 95 TaxID=260716 RepID=Q705D5_9PAPI|nr:E4 protein [Human papillomavirus 95]
MVCSLQTIQESVHILHCLAQMLKDIARLDYGLCILKPRLFPPLLLALQTPPPSTSRNNYPGPPPATPKLPSRRPLGEGDRSRGNYNHPPQRPLKGRGYEYDDDEDKENQGPGQEKPPAKEEEEEEEEEKRNLDLHQLLQKWDQDIDKLKRKVCHDLDNYKQTLGIRQ